MLHFLVPVASEPPKKRATYQDVLDAPPHMVAEVLDGELHLMQRPRLLHLLAGGGIGAFLFGTFQAGSGGPGGWWILDEPELHLGSDILVPDLAGWRRERLSPGEDDAFVSIAPDWACEILSPSTQRIDRVKKLPIYAREKVGHVWLVDPRDRTVEVFRHAGEGFALVGTFDGDQGLRAEPFDAVEIPPAFLWGGADAK